MRSIAGRPRRRGPGAAPLALLYGKSSRSESGFALLIVLLALALLGVITARLLGAARAQLAVTGNMRAAAMAGAAAEGGIAEAIIHLDRPLQGPQATGLWRIGGLPHVVRIGATVVSVRTASINGRINPNSAPLPLLVGLMRAVGEPPAEARQLAGAIVAWRSPPTSLAGEQALDAAYRRAGRIGAPNGTKFATLGALGAVLGMTPALLARLRPHLSLQAPPLPEAALAGPAVRMALRFAGPLTIRGIPVVAAPMAQIEAIGRGPDHARAARCAVVSLTAGNFTQPYRILSESDAPCAQFDAAAPR